MGQSQGSATQLVLLRFARCGESIRGARVADFPQNGVRVRVSVSVSCFPYPLSPGCVLYMCLIPCPLPRERLHLHTQHEYGQSMFTALAMPLVQAAGDIKKKAKLARCLLLALVNPDSDPSQVPLFSTC